MRHMVANVGTMLVKVHMAIMTELVIILVCYPMAIELFMIFVESEVMV